MARNHARILTSIWDNDDFLGLEPEAQRVYLMLVSQPDLTPCGALPYLPVRWARLSKLTTEQEITDAIDELQACRFVVVDHDTQELIVRTFVVHDGGLGNPKMRGAVKSALKALHSRRLRAEIAAVIPDEHRAAIVDGLSIEWQSNDDPERGASAIGSNVEVGGRRQSPVVLASESSSPRAAEDHAATPPKRASRLPEAFEITDEMLEWAEGRTPGLDLVHHTERFENYWRSKPGRGGTQLDWVATWRNWMLKEYAARPFVPPLAAATPRRPPAECTVGNPECRDGFIDTPKGAAECDCRRARETA